MRELGHPVPRQFRHHGTLQFLPEGELAVDDEVWVPPILRTVATEGDGVPELASEIARHRDHLESSGEWQNRDRARLAAELDLLLQGKLVERWRMGVSDIQLQQTIDGLVARQLSPHQAVNELLDGGQEA
jgi:LAO/AO transport system kinase